MDADGVSVTTGYIINLGTATTMIAVMFFAFQGMFTTVQDQTSGTETRTVGEKVAASLQKADRLADRGSGTVEMSYPRFENSYTVKITDNGGGRVYVTTGTTNVSVEYSVDSDVKNLPYEFSDGERVEIQYENANPKNEIEVTR